MGWSRVGTRCVQRRCFAWGRCYSIQWTWSLLFSCLLWLSEQP
jgi:hypothetical protein